MNELSWLKIDLSHLQGNLAWWRQVIAAPDATPGSQPVKVCAVVKANAYGLGAVPIAQRLGQAGADMLAVYSPAQAEELIDAGIATPILVLMPTRQVEHTPAIHAAAMAQRLHLAINDLQQLAMVADLGRMLGCQLPVHLHLDTGMSRAGLNAPQFAQGLASIAQAPEHLRLAGIFSHFATADSDLAVAQAQLARFDAVLQANARYIGRDVIVHLSNTFGVCRDRRFHKNMIRIGLGLHGYGPELVHGDTLPMTHLGTPPDSHAASNRPVPRLQPVVQWLARIIHRQHYPAGASVSYGCTHRLSRDSILGVVPVGYADGYPQSLSNKAAVAVLDQTGQPRGLAPVLGTVSMDQIVIDLTDLPADLGQVEGNGGGMVELISDDPDSPLALPRVAKLAGVSCYEMLCRMSPRLPRRYVD